MRPHYPLRVAPDPGGRLAAMSVSSAPCRRARRVTTGAAALLAAGALVAACAPSPDGGSGAADGESSDATSSSETPPPPPEAEDHSTSVVPTSLSDADVSAPKPSPPVDVCSSVGLDVAQVAKIVGIDLAASRPAAPGGQLGMCAYGSRWDDPDALFGSMKGSVDDGSDEDSSSSSAADDSSSAAPSSPSSDDDEDAGRVTYGELRGENSVFVYARPFQKGDSPKDMLASIPDLAGPLYSCSMSTKDVPAPVLETTAPPTTGAAPLDGVSSLGTLAGTALPTQIGKAPAATSSAGSTSTSPASTSSKAAATSSRAPAAAKPIHFDVVRCDSTPTGASPHTQAFFIAHGSLWQVSATTPGRSEDDLPLDTEAQGLLSLAAYIAGDHD